MNNKFDNINLNSFIDDVGDKSLNLCSCFSLLLKNKLRESLTVKTASLIHSGVDLFWNGDDLIKLVLTFCIDNERFTMTIDRVGFTTNIDTEIINFCFGKCSVNFEFEEIDSECEPFFDHKLMINKKYKFK